MCGLAAIFWVDTSYKIRTNQKEVKNQTHTNMIQKLLNQRSVQLLSYLRPDPSPVTSEHLIHLIGLKRSGLHALSFWILGHKEKNMLVNNSPLKKPGSGSYMSRTDRLSPLPVVVRQNDEVAVYKDHRERFQPLGTHSDLSIVVFQSQSLPYLNSQPRLTTGVEAKAVRQILTLRDPFNWAASYIKKSQQPEDYAV